MLARIISPRGSVRTRPIPAGFIFSDLCTGRCRGCGGAGRRDHPIPDGHPKRNPALPARACHECNGTGRAHVWEGSRIAAMLDVEAERVDRAPQGETVRLFTPAPTEIPGQLAL
jgi:hypothetical protein